MTGKLILLQDFIKEINLKELLMLKLKKLCLDSKNTLFLCSLGILEY